MRVRAFQILDYKSIIDSRVCEISGDNITILAGKNESGKTNILLGLKDFYTKHGEAIKTEDYMPEDRPDAQPKVRIQF